MLKTLQSPDPYSYCNVEDNLLHDTSKLGMWNMPNRIGLRLKKVQSFIQSSCIEGIPIRCGMVYGKSRETTICLDLPCA
jgi:hypothetical protein